MQCGATALIVNVAIIAGMKIAGTFGAVCATVGFCTPSLILGIIRQTMG